MGEYQLFTDATADISVDMMAEMPEARVIPMNVEIGGREYIYGPGGTITAKEFYRLQREGSFATTSQVPPPTYFKFLNRAYGKERIFCTCVFLPVCLEHINLRC